MLSAAGFCIGLLLLSTGCNGDVFVDELQVSATELLMNPEGGSSVVRVNKGLEWDVVSIEPTVGTSFYGKHYNETGKMTFTGSISFLGIWMKGLGKLVYRNDVNGFEVVRSQNDRLEIIVDENRSGNLFEFAVVISDYNYKTIRIKVAQPPSTRMLSVANEPIREHVSAKAESNEP